MGNIPDIVLVRADPLASEYVNGYVHTRIDGESEIVLGGGDSQCYQVDSTNYVCVRPGGRFYEGVEVAAPRSDVVTTVKVFKANQPGEGGMVNRFCTMAGRDKAQKSFSNSCAGVGRVVAFFRPGVLGEIASRQKQAFKDLKSLPVDSYIIKTPDSIFVYSKNPNDGGTKLLGIDLGTGIITYPDGKKVGFGALDKMRMIKVLNNWLKGKTTHKI